MNIDARLMEILVCPVCRATVTPDVAAGELVCNGCGLAYPVRDDIPVMLVDEARKPTPDEPPEPEAAPPLSEPAPARPSEPS